MGDAAGMLLLTLLLVARGAHALGGREACATLQTCAQCIRTPACTWCASQNFSEKVGVSRCRSTRNKDALRTWCDENYIINPESGKTTPIKDEPFKGSTGDEVTNPVQMKPQRVKLSLRVGEYSNLTIRYKRARDRPVDMYYLLDMSASLESVKNSVAELTAEIQNLTSSLQLGFGSFLDKDVRPFNMSPQQQFPNYKKLSHEFSRIYSFKNHMALSRDVTRVQEAVNSLKSLILPTCYKCVRGLLDGVMQAMVCNHELKWRHKAYRLLVVPTDKDYHIAGDGKFAGLVEVNDGYCHLSDHGEYTHSLVFDYPSISQVKRTSKDNNINIILVTPEESAEKYRALEEMIDEVSVVSYPGSHNLASYITDEFKKISGTVKLEDNRGDNVDVKYFTDCGNQEETESDTCTYADYDDEIIFTARIKVTSCPAGGAQGWRQLVIRPVGVDDSLVVQLDVACDCERCDSDAHLSESNSSKCSGQGDLQCGACVCHEGFVGSRCECASSSTPEQDNPVCRGSNGKTCSGYGSCICSTCQCSRRPNPQERYYGHLCECDNFSCKRHDGEVCGGNGDCSCGKCVCHPGWTGEACQCADTMDGCRRSGETTICNGRGRCECGQCVCSQTEDGHHYSGQYCEESPYMFECGMDTTRPVLEDRIRNLYVDYSDNSYNLSQTGPGLKCKFFQKCAECEVSSSKISDECRNCSFYNAVLLDDIRDDGYDSDVDKICPISLEEKCVFYYRYRFQNSLYRLWVQKEMDCSPNILGIIFGVIGFTFLVGLLIILVWKFLTSIHDKKEFAKFERERAKAKWDQHGNPLFKPSTTFFTNPTFGKE